MRNFFARTYRNGVFDEIGSRIRPEPLFIHLKKENERKKKLRNRSGERKKNKRRRNQKSTKSRNFFSALSSEQFAANAIRNQITNPFAYYPYKEQVNSYLFPRTSLYSKKKCLYFISYSYLCYTHFFWELIYENSIIRKDITRISCTYIYDIVLYRHKFILYLYFRKKVIKNKPLCAWKSFPCIDFHSTSEVCVCKKMKINVENSSRKISLLSSAPSFDMRRI